jgi:hypothetical protein
MEDTWRKDGRRMTLRCKVNDSINLDETWKRRVLYKYLNKKLAHSCIMEMSTTLMWGDNFKNEKGKEDE